MNPFEQENQNLPEQIHPKPLSVKEWLIVVVISAIPIIGFIMLMVWAFDDSTNIHKKNFSRAYLLFFVIMFIITLIFYVTVFATLIGGMGIWSSYQ